MQGKSRAGQEDLLMNELAVRLLNAGKWMGEQTQTSGSKPVKQRLLTILASFAKNVISNRAVQWCKAK